LTDADVARVPPAQIQEAAEQARAAAGAQEGDERAEADGDSEAAEAVETGEEEAEKPGLRISDWEDRISDEGGTILTGTVRNEGEALATGIRVAITLVNRDGQPVATGQATLDRTTLVPGASTQFRADFPDVIGFAEARFETGSIPLQYQRGTIGEEGS
ncbi:MAG: FxLYD domain-containing protein, partial [Thermoanaerobaculia bacterium]|nr:FxLYD domain-containing protein [Thermoanaerobaculia bacterium]